MTAQELRQKYLEFFKSKGHAIVPSAKLIPENDPTTLFTGSGMQPMLPYLLGEKHPLGTRVTDSQKSFRANDIEEIGDNRHTTFFEMLGNWSLGDYFKKEQIEWMFDFLMKEIKLNPNNFYVSVFRGNEEIGIPKDEEAVELWQQKFKEVGIDANAVDFSEKNGMQGGRIFYYDEKKNWWSRSGVPKDMPIGEPGGPCTEMFWDFGDDLKLHENSKWKDEPCHVNCDCGRFLEIGNNVFMTYLKTTNGFEVLKQKNVDYGGGLERQVAAVSGDPDIFKIDVFAKPLKVIEELSGKKYEENEEAFRVILDHLRAATFLIGDGVGPSNKDQGYFVRRLIRRAVRFAHRLEITNNFCGLIAKEYITTYKNAYDNLGQLEDKITGELEMEEIKFRKTLEKGLREFEKYTIISGKTAFDLYQTYGFPLEMIQEECKNKGLEFSQIEAEEFKKELEMHQQLSRTASAGKFKGGLGSTGEIETKYHTATHMLQAALRQVLGDHVFQKGSNITAERLRFDFSHQDKMTDDQIKKVEDLINDAISKDLPVIKEEMTVEEAKAHGALGVFESKYGERVSVYSIGYSPERSDSKVEGEQYFSREICGGPHVKSAGELGKFKITKEESVSAGVRRIKATLE